MKLISFKYNDSNIISWGILQDDHIIDLDEFYWFCLQHVAAYNRSWDYFQGMGQEEIEKFRKAWNKVNNKKSQEDPLWAEIWASYNAFREKYKIWGSRAYLK